MSKRSQEGYLLIDNRYGDGIENRQSDVPELQAGAVFESATVTCSHCQRIVVLNPNRTRERAWCRKCDNYVCDGCAGAAALGKCKTFEQIIDEHLTEAHKNTAPIPAIITARS